MAPLVGTTGVAVALTEAASAVPMPALPSRLKACEGHGWRRAGDGDGQIGAGMRHRGFSMGGGSSAPRCSRQTA